MAEIRIGFVDVLVEKRGTLSLQVICALVVSKAVVVFSENLPAGICGNMVWQISWTILNIIFGALYANVVLIPIGSLMATMAPVALRCVTAGGIPLSIFLLMLAEDLPRNIRWIA